MDTDVNATTESLGQFLMGETTHLWAMVCFIAGAFIMLGFLYATKKIKEAGGLIEIQEKKILSEE